MKPVVDKENCIGCGVCESVCPDIFQIADDGKAIVINNGEFDQDCADDAIAQCPVQCITMHE